MNPVYIVRSGQEYSLNVVAVFPNLDDAVKYAESYMNHELISDGISFIEHPCHTNFYFNFTMTRRMKMWKMNSIRYDIIVIIEEWVSPTTPEFLA